MLMKVARLVQVLQDFFLFFRSDLIAVRSIAYAVVAEYTTL